MSDEIESKVRLTMPEYLYNTLVSDESDFGLNQNKLCNMVFEIYHEHVELELQSDRTKFNRILQFSLNKDNLDLYADINSRTQICNKAGYFRHLFEVYCNQPKYKRELALCSKTVQLINIGIQNAQKLKIKYKNEIRAIEP